MQFCVPRTGRHAAARFTTRATRSTSPLALSARTCPKPNTKIWGSVDCLAIDWSGWEVVPMFLDFHGLLEQPFGVTPDPTYLYPTQTHREALESLSSGIKADRGFLALVAEPGMGKTTLLYQLLQELRESARTVYLFNTQCDSRELLRYILHELGIDTQGMGLVAMHTKLNAMLFDEMLAGKRFVLVVDEAQNLSESVLETV